LNSNGLNSNGLSGSNANGLSGLKSARNQIGLSLNSLNEDQGLIITLLDLLQINGLSEADIGKNRSAFQNTMAKLKIK
jgi:hypothetical protein